MESALFLACYLIFSCITSTPKEYNQVVKSSISPYLAGDLSLIDSEPSSGRATLHLLNIPCFDKFLHCQFFKLWKSTHCGVDTEQPNRTSGIPQPPPNPKHPGLRVEVPA
ncbi:hypothetical protein BU16DRAFT_59931 [Lophium mytilinum]|uniref:Uncharacterized protein n=1 Tax=Lophium mytilinum TaxID=390894 RepID=A0A6A6QPJ4_9PEZI|nr:hypothetical protein BU16DRAFT_59931 [Lophium mytilinum]